jgi:hypothetical protein
MSHPPELLQTLLDASERLGKDAAEVRALLEAGDVALALEVLIDQYDALGAPLPSSLERFGWIAQLRSDAEDLLELLAAEGEHRFDPGVSALLAELSAALAGDEAAERVAADLVKALFQPGRVEDFSLWDDDPARRALKNAPLDALKRRLRTLGARLGEERQP